MEKWNKHRKAKCFQWGIKKSNLKKKNWKSDRLHLCSSHEASTAEMSSFVKLIFCFGVYTCFEGLKGKKKTSGKQAEYQWPQNSEVWHCKVSQLLYRHMEARKVSFTASIFQYKQVQSHLSCTRSSHQDLIAEQCTSSPPKASGHPLKKLTFLCQANTQWPYRNCTHWCKKGI